MSEKENEKENEMERSKRANTSRNGERRENERREKKKVDTTPPGFEPGQRAPKTLVLPLHYEVTRKIMKILSFDDILIKTFV